MKLEDFFKSFVWDKLVELVLQRLFLEVPFLAWGPVGVITKAVVGLIANRLYEHLKLFVDLQVIAFRNKEHQKAFDLAAVELKLLAMQKGPDSAEFKEAREKAKSALSNFVRFDKL